MDIKKDFSKKWIKVDGEEFLIQFLPEDLRLKMQSECTVEGKLDETLFGSRVIDHVLWDWGDSIKSNGKKAKCNLENKAALVISNPKIAHSLVTKALFRQTFHTDIKEIVKNLIGQSDISDNGKKEEVTEAV